jgi:uncharacterized protein (TIGR03086 family)
VLLPGLLDDYRRVAAWSSSITAGAVDRLDAATPCEGWDVRTLLNHIVDAQRSFAASARGEEVTWRPDAPPELIGDDPAGALDAARADTIAVFSEPGVIERTGITLGAAFGDLLIHTWDLAVATGQDATMPAGLAEQAYAISSAGFSDDQRDGILGPRVEVGADASAQERLLAFSGRDPHAG